MSTFTLDVPDDVLTAARQIAQATAQPVEQVLLSRLKTALPLPILPPDEEAELDALKHLSDDALWTIAREQMPDDAQAQMLALMDKNSLGTISPDEYKTLETLVDRGQRLMLRKSEAAAPESARHDLQDRREWSSLHFPILIYAVTQWK